jgi:RND family efflux transporter MFP subunit
MSQEKTSPEQPTPAPPPSSVVPPSKRRWYIRLLLVWIIPLVIVAAAALFAKHLIDTRPSAKRQTPPPQARLVAVRIAEPVNHQTSVSAMGPVVPAKRIILTPEVSGRVVYISPLVIPGGTIEQGQVLLRIDERDYVTLVKQRQSEVSRAELNIKLEQGNQLVAQQEYELLGEIVQDQDRELVLRQPHLEEARAALEAAKAALTKAQLDVERCTVKAPFNAVIQEKFVDVGAQVAMNSSLLIIMGTDEYWVQAKVNVDQLRWITVPDGDREQGSAAKVFNEAAWGPDAWRQARVLRLLGQLEEQGRLAQVLVSVQDPLTLESAAADLPPVLVDSYVRVEMQGAELTEVYPVPRDYLHDGAYIWVMNDENRMEIRPVEVAFRDKQTVYLSGGLQAGDRIVTTDISAPVEGMLLRLNGTADAAEPAQEKPQAADPEAKE